MCSPLFLRAATQMKYQLSIFLIILNCSGNLSVSATIPYSARSSGLSGINTILDDVHAVAENPSQNTEIKKITIGIGAESPYYIQGLQSLSFSFVFPFREFHAFAFHCSRLGTKEFYHQDFRLSYGISISPKLNIGAQIEKKERVYTPDPFHTYSAWMASIGFSTKPIAGLSLGASISNPNHAHWSNEQKSALPSILRLGSTLSISTKVKMYAQLDKESMQKVDFISGIEYTPRSQIQLRMGIATAPFQASLGASILWKNTRVDFSTTSQFQLGISSGVSIIQSFR